MLLSSECTYETEFAKPNTIGVNALVFKSISASYASISTLYQAHFRLFCCSRLLAAAVIFRPAFSFLFFSFFQCGQSELDRPTPATAALTGVIKTFSTQHQLVACPPMSDSLPSNCPCVVKLGRLENVFVIVLKKPQPPSRE